MVGWGVAALAAVAFCVWRRTWLPALFMGLVAAGIGGLYVITTSVVTRQRPPVKILDPGLVPDHSFPSGHVATAVAAYGGIMLLAWSTPGPRGDGCGCCSCCRSSCCSRGSTRAPTT